MLYKHTSFLLGAALAMLLCSVATAQPSIDLVYPPQGHKMPPVSGSFIYGSVTPGSVLSANGRKVEVLKSGAFMAFLPFAEGDFTIKLVAINDWGQIVLERTVSVARSRTLVRADTLAIVAGSIRPQQELALARGDWLSVSFKGTPGMKGSFSVGTSQGQPMVEQRSQPEPDAKNMAFSENGEDTLTLPGTYNGSCMVSCADVWQQERIYCYLVDSLGNMAVDSTAGLVTVWPESLQAVGVIKDSLAILKTGPDLGYELFLPQGIRLRLTGIDDDYYRTRLSGSKDAWLKRESVQLLPRGTPLGLATVAIAKTERSGQVTYVRVSLSRAVAYQTEASGDCRSLRLWLYGCRADMDWVRYDPQDRLVRRVSWRQPESEMVELDIELAEPLWGYHAEYRGSALVLTIRPKPRISPKRPFAGLRVAIDAGHSPEAGAVGPLRNLEKDLNWRIAQRLGRKLSALGAAVYYTREGGEEVGIYQRPRRAAQWQADILVSVHNNASPDGANPLRNSGFSTYYYQPQSRDLAWEVHRQFRRNLPLPDHGFYYGNLVLCRATEMPSFLVEPTFIIVPKEEALLLTERFQDQVAQSIVNGMRSFLAGAKGQKAADEEPERVVPQVELPEL